MVNVYEIRPGSYATKAEVADAETEGGVTKEYVDAGLAEKQDVLTAGTNITIVENVISATGGAEYTAGSGIAISDQNVISNTAQPDVDKAYVDAQLALKANSASLATVATSGSYEDLSNKPTIPSAQVNSDWNASSGVAEILNKPTIPSGADLVPSTTGASTGDVLTVGSSGPEWAGASAPSNMVTTDTAQTITANKTLKKEDPILTFNHYNAYDHNDYKMNLIGSAVANISFQPTAALHITTGNNIYTAIYSFFDESMNLVTSYTDPRVINFKFFREHLDTNTNITGDGTTTAFTVTHTFDKMPSIVQVTDSTGTVVKDSEITIVKSTTNVVVTFNTAPADQATYTVAMLY